MQFSRVALSSGTVRQHTPAARAEPALLKTRVAGGARRLVSGNTSGETGSAR